MIRKISSLVPVLLLGALSSCTLVSTSRDFSHLQGPRGEPVYLKSGTNIGFNLLVFIPIPFLGSTSVTPMVRDVTQSIAEEKGNRVRIVESTGENYWYGFPPFTWIVTPVITTVRAEYEPDPAVYAENEAALREAGR